MMLRQRPRKLVTKISRNAPLRVGVGEWRTLSNPDREENNDTGSSLQRSNIEPERENFMRVAAKASCAIGILAAVALTASAADARTVNVKRFGGAHASVPAPYSPVFVPVPHGNSSVPYAPENAPYPNGHGGKTSSPDFQIVG